MLRSSPQNLILPAALSAGLHLVVGGALFVSGLSQPSLESPEMSVMRVDLVTMTKERILSGKVEIKAKTKAEVEAVAKVEVEVKSEVKAEGSADSMRTGPDEMPVLLAQQVSKKWLEAMTMLRDKEEQRFMQEVRSRLEQAKRYPWQARMRGMEGTVRLEFVINANGEAEKIRLVESSKWTVLDEEAIATVGRVDRFPGPPSGWNREVSVLVPLVFKLEGQ